MSIEIKGVGDVIARLGRIAAVQVLEPPMQRAVYRLQARMQDYPPAPATSRYIRTGTLGRRWTTRIAKSSNGITGTIGNNTAYGPYVQSERFQTRTHKRTGWRTDQNAVDQERAAIVADFEQAIQKALR